MHRIEYSAQSLEDMRDLSDTITFTYSAPATAKRYMQGLKDSIQNIAKNPEAYPIRFNLSLLEYGLNARRLNYKKMAIIYTVNDDETVYIHRVIASSLITEA
jgi:plasmid stabilization system protein ParE